MYSFTNQGNHLMRWGNVGGMSPATSIKRRIQQQRWHFLDLNSQLNLNDYSPTKQLKYASFLS